MTDVSAQPPKHSFSKTLREDGRVFVLQKNRNDHGKFVLVMEYGTQRSKGSIVILEWHDRWGWRGFNLALTRLLGQS